MWDDPHASKLLYPNTIMYRNPPIQCCSSGKCKTGPRKMQNLTLECRAHIHHPIQNVPEHVDGLDMECREPETWNMYIFGRLCVFRKRGSRDSREVPWATQAHQCLRCTIAQEEDWGRSPEPLVSCIGTSWPMCLHFVGSNGASLDSRVVQMRLLGFVSSSPGVMLMPVGAYAEQKAPSVESNTR
ncbi:hypothetical protein LZ30DRAFT_238879 [Colletotrichum cereale]|nr:hypothetical protein LZ30DRAFT_238879 [Colletotrichum cereale]